MKKKKTILETERKLRNTYYRYCYEAGIPIYRLTVNSTRNDITSPPVNPFDYIRIKVLLS